MITVNVTKHTRKMIDAYSREGETVDKTIARLLKSTEPLQIQDRTVTNITIHEDTFNNLKSYKAYPTQSHSDTILELIRASRDEE